MAAACEECAEKNVMDNGFSFTGVLKTLAGDVMQLWPVWSVQRLKCYERGFFHS